MATSRSAGAAPASESAWLGRLANELVNVGEPAGVLRAGVRAAVQILEADFACVLEHGAGEGAWQVIESAGPVDVDLPEPLFPNGLPPDVRDQLMEASGMQSCLVEDLRSWGKPAILAVLWREPGRDGDGAQSRLDALAAVLSLGLAAHGDAAREAMENERLLALVNTSPVGIFIADETGKILLMNREAERIVDTNYSQTERLEEHGLAPEMLYPDGTLIPVMKRPLNRALYGGETVRFAEVLFRRSGETLTTLVNSTPFHSPDGKLAGAIAVIQDISRVEELERLRGEFLGMISHELRTPLTIIKGSSSLALSDEKVGDPLTRHYFEIIDDQADRLRSLVDNLLDMTAIEAGRLSVQPRPLSLPGFLHRAAEGLRQAGVPQEIVLDIEEPPADVIADEIRIMQVLHNLITNASKFSPATAPIVVRARRDQDYVTISVIDQGKGISASQQEGIFRKFFRLSSDGSGGPPGLGLGLAICRGVVEAHGGRIWVESEGEGRGASFNFTLPVSHEADLPVDPAAVPSGYDRTKATILAIDDDPQMLRYLQRSLGGSGFGISTTAEPGEALRALADLAPDLVILDLYMGGRSRGFELLRDVRNSSDVPIIILTGSSSEDDAVRALRLGADDYVRKPFSAAELDARVRAILRRRAKSPPVKPPFSVGDLKIDFLSRRVTLAGEELDLSATEYNLLSELALNAGRVVSHRQLLERVWGSEYSTETHLIRSFIKLLRRKLRDDAAKPRYIFTERQVGYRLARQ